MHLSPSPPSYTYLLVPFVCVELGIQVWLFRSSKGRVPLPSCDILYIGDNERTRKDADPDPLPAGQPARDVRPIQLADSAKRGHIDFVFVVVVVAAAVVAVVVAATVVVVLVGRDGRRRKSATRFPVSKLDSYDFWRGKEGRYNKAVHAHTA